MLGFPRVRGDGPFDNVLTQAKMQFPPRARGWTPTSERAGWRREVSPACAGMDPHRVGPFRWQYSFPRVRGDGPDAASSRRVVKPFPPRARGWTLYVPLDQVPVVVSPACAGMDPFDSG